MQSFIFENVRNHLAQPRWLGSTPCPAQRASGSLPPNAPFKFLTRTSFKSSSQSPERTISTQSPDETIPPKAPMKNYTQKRQKKIAKKSVFLVSGKGLGASQVSAEGPAARTCSNTPKDWMAAWSNLEYYFYYIGTNASLKGLRSWGFPHSIRFCFLHQRVCQAYMEAIQNRLWSLFCSCLRHAKFTVHCSNALFEPALCKALAPKPLLLFALCCSLCLSRAGLFSFPA